MAGRLITLLYFALSYRYNKRHVALLIAYLGWDYSGFASQVTTTQTIEVSRERLINPYYTARYNKTH